MKLLFAAVSLLTGLQAQAVLNTDYEIQKFPGRVYIEADINVSSVSSTALDVLFVVDNSGSMTPHQKSLAQASAQIDAALSSMNRDYQLGVISADVEARSWGGYQPGVLRGSPKIITPKNMPSALAANLVVGIDGSGHESPFSSVVQALSEPRLSGENAGFLRPDASLAIVFLTDAEDQSAIEPQAFKDFLGTLKGDLGRVTAYSWIVPSYLGDSDCERDEFARLPQRIEDLTKSLSGEIYNICEMNSATIGDFTQKLAQFNVVPNAPPPSADIFEVPLTIQPVFSTIEVRYGTQVLTKGDLQEGWVYDASKNAVILGPKIPWTYQRPGTKLIVSFVPAEWTK